MSDDAVRRPAAAVRFRGGGFEARPLAGAGWLGFAVVLAGWQVAVGTRLVDPVFLPSPWNVLLALGDLVASGELFRHLAASLGRIVLGWLIGTAAGLLIGGTMGIFALARAVGLPLISALFPIPKIALLPLLILWFGIGEPSKVATLALGVFFPTAIATFTGMDAVPRNLIRMAQSFDVPAVQIVRKVVLPGALPGI